MFANMKEIPEQTIQQQAYMWFNNEYCLLRHSPRLLIHSVPNGIPIQIKEQARILDLLQKTGMVNGISDLIVHGVNGRCIMAECKTESGHQSEAQQLIQRRIQDLGGKYFVFRSLDDFKQKIQKKIDWLLDK
jgi:hypothetical protein